jgi:hypothetical protein
MNLIKYIEKVLRAVETKYRPSNKTMKQQKRKIRLHAETFTKSS